MKLNKKELIPFQSIFVIAEIASAHEGEVSLAKELAKVASTTSADAVKFQFLNAESLLVPSHHKFKSFQELQFSSDEWKEIIEYTKSLGLFIIAEVYDEASLKLAVDLKVSVLKVPTSDLVNPSLLSEVASLKVPTILSVGASKKEEIDFALQVFEKHSHKDLVLMTGFQNFPTKVEDTKFSLIPFLKNNYSYLIGFADHIDAESSLADRLPLVAIGYGATVIEKHITLDRSKKGRDYYSALNPDEFQRMVQNIREIEKAFGKADFGESDAEVTYRELMKKKVVVKEDIPAESLLEIKDFLFRRSDEKGVGPDQLSKLLKKTKKPISKFEAVKEEDLV